MSDPRGFINTARKDRRYLPVADRVTHYQEFVEPLSDEALHGQASRCMDCGVPFCHTGCPVNNIIPDFNNLVHEGDWRRALESLHSTNNFPEFTGRICPAPCEEACTLTLNEAPVTIKTIEHAIIERAWSEGWIVPHVPSRTTGSNVAVVGSGPAGMACAQQLARAGHHVTVYEKNRRIGGLLRYGIPDFKLEKHVIDRRMSQMQAEGVAFRINSEVGRNIEARRLMDQFDAVVLAAGCEVPRELKVEGRALDGVHYAMDYLRQNNKRVAGEPFEEPDILATGKHVVVIGGGDTGSDCVGTANRQGALSVTQIGHRARPPEQPDRATTWPHWPSKLRTSSSHEEGVTRLFGVQTTGLRGDGRVQHLDGVEVVWTKIDGEWQVTPTPGTECVLKADLVLLAMGFSNPTRRLLELFSIPPDERGNATANEHNYQTSTPGVFAAGDVRRGQSLVVWAIREGRQAAAAVDEFLMGSTVLPR